MNKIELLTEIVKKQDELINWFDDGKTEGDAVIRKKIADLQQQLAKLDQCKNIIAEVKEAWTPDKRSFEEVEKEKQIQNDCNNCAFGICLTKDWPCNDCNGSNKWEPINE